jgi:hypothetical protein
MPLRCAALQAKLDSLFGWLLQWQQNCSNVLGSAPEHATCCSEHGWRAQSDGSGKRCGDAHVPFLATVEKGMRCRSLAGLTRSAAILVVARAIGPFGTKRAACQPMRSILQHPP